MRRGRGLAAALIVAAAIVGGFASTTRGAASPGSARAESVVRASFLYPFKPVWRQPLSQQIVYSSPNIANLDGQPSVVVGDRGGRVLAYHLSNRAQVSGWPYQTFHAIDSTPSVSAAGPGGRDVVYIGSGNTGTPGAGAGYFAINPNGSKRWHVDARNPKTDKKYPYGGVVASLTAGRIQGSTAVAAGNLGQNFYALRGGQALGGFPWLTTDTVWSTAALSATGSTGTQRIIFGGDSTANPDVYGIKYGKGGRLTILRETGNTGRRTRGGGPQPNGGAYCTYPTDEVIQSSPAVGMIGNPSRLAVVFGTGDYYRDYNKRRHLAAPKDSNRVYAIDLNCKKIWKSADLGSPTRTSPALVNLLGDRTSSGAPVLRVVQTTENGQVYALSGNSGTEVWHASTHTNIRGIGSVATADLSGKGYQDVIVATTGGIFVYDFKQHTYVGHMTYCDPGCHGVALQNSPLVTREANGHIGLTVAGYVGLGGEIQHFEFTGANGASVDDRGSWPVFHHDPWLTGNASKGLTRVGFSNVHVP